MNPEKKTEMVAYRFAATSHEVRTVVINQEPYFVAKDVCDILGLTDTSMALKSLDDDEKLTQKIFGSGQNRKMWLVSESGLYALIMRSNKPEAKAFRKWVTKEVLPAIRKKGYYRGFRPVINDYVDARNVPYSRIIVNDYPVKTILLEDEKWHNLADIIWSMGKRTETSKLAARINAKEQLAKKIWLYGQSCPAWYVNSVGLHLILSTYDKKPSVWPSNLPLQLDLNFEDVELKTKGDE